LAIHLRELRRVRCDRVRGAFRQGLRRSANDRPLPGVREPAQVAHRAHRAVAWERRCVRRRQW
jgi:hypothetical protein